MAMPLIFDASHCQKVLKVTSISIQIYIECGSGTTENDTNLRGNHQRTCWTWL